MKNLTWIEKLVPVLFLGLLIAAVGCGETATTETVSTNQPTQSTAATTALSASNLTGVWMGEAMMDKEKLQRKISQLDAEAQKLVGERAKSFLSTVMAMEFRENGTVQNEVEILTTEGKLLRDGSVASWQVLESKPDGLLVQTQEKLADGTVASDQLFYHFSDDRNRIVIQIPVIPELQGCDAMIVFDRQTLPPTNVAARPTGTLAK